MGEPIRLGIIGLNTQGGEHLVAAESGSDFRVTALCDVDTGLLDRHRDRASPVRLFNSVEALFGARVMDAAVVAVPHHVHASVVALAARHGVHLLKEKPLGRSLHEAQRISASMRDAGLVLHTGVQRRHHGTYLALSNRLREAAEVALTASLDLTIAAGQATGWRGDFAKSGGGVFIDLGYHAIDLLQFLLGPLELVSCLFSSEGRPCVAGTVEDEARVMARAGRAWVSIRVGRAQTKREQLLLQCKSGRYFADRTVVRWEAEGSAEKTIIAAHDASWQETHRSQLSTFAAAIRERQVASNDLESQIPALRFIEACYAKAPLQGIVAPSEVAS